MAAAVEDERVSGTLDRYFCLAPKAGDTAGQAVDLRGYRWLTRGLLRFAGHGWRDFAACEIFDRAVAARLDRPARIVGFSARALDTFRRGRRLGADALDLEAPNSHVAHVRRQQHLAERASPVERGWLTPFHVRKSLLEYDIADRIVVLSDYAWRTFVEAGVPESKLRRRVLPISPRFAPPARPSAHDRFTVVYVGRLDVIKGLTILLDAFAAFDDPDAELILVGHPATDAMADWVDRRRRADPRITLRPGDPLPALHRADVLVHAAFEDGLALAPLEALACGVPVIVSADTGMKEFVTAGRDGFVVPTGDVDAIVDRLRWVRAHPMRGTFAPPSLAPALRVDR